MAAIARVAPLMLAGAQATLLGAPALLWDAAFLDFAPRYGPLLMRRGASR
jgi:uncharacterized protein involved in response to NO